MDHQNGISRTLPASLLNAMMESNDEEDAVLVDSFFLPGGLLADDDDVINSETSDNHVLAGEESSRRNASSMSSVRGKVPSNPWEGNREYRSSRRDAMLILPAHATGANSTMIDVALEGENGILSNHQPLSLRDQRLLNGSSSVNIHHPSDADGEKEKGFASLIHHHTEQSVHDATKGGIAPPPGFHQPLAASKWNTTSSIDYKISGFPTPTEISKDYKDNGIEQNNDSAMDGEILQMNLQSKIMHTNWDYEFSGPLKRLNNPAIQRPLHSAGDYDSSMAPDAGKGSRDISVLLSTHGPTIDAQSLTTPELSNRGLDENDDEDADGSYTEFLSPLTTETKEMVKSIEMDPDDGALCDDEEGDDDEGDDEGNDEDDDDDDVEDTSIPIDICENSVGESIPSSLSSSSDMDNSDASSRASDETDCDENEHSRGEPAGYDTDQACVSQIVGITDEDKGTGNNRAHADSLSLSPGIMRPTEEPPKSLSSMNQCQHQQQYSHDFIGVLQNSWREVLSLSFAMIVHYPAKAVLRLSTSIFTTIRQSPLCSSLTRQSEFFIKQIHKLATCFCVIWEWLVDFKEVPKALTAKFITAIRKLLEIITNSLILIASFLLQIWKFSLIEAIEESNVTICYLVFYSMPSLCSFLMRHVNFPHWTPHLMTSLGVFSLCHQVKSGPLQDNVSIFRLSSTLTSNSVKGKSSLSTVRETDQLEDISRPRDERACQIILRILRLVLPLFFLADGFTSEFGTIMGVSGASRLTTAFMMALVRKNLVSSPIGWVSWAIQVLVATYYPNWTILDVIVLVVGLSSIRLIRYLDGQRLTSNRKTDKKG